MLVFVLVVLLAALGCTNANDLIFRRPQPVVAPLGSFGRFECGAEGDDIAIEWFVDFIGLNANTTEKCFTSGEGREDGTAKSVLCINTTGVNDNVTVQCRAYSGSSADKSREVTLTVQDRPSPPADLRVNTNSTCKTIHLRWKRPLPRTAIYGYIVHIINKNTNSTYEFKFGKFNHPDPPKSCHQCLMASNQQAPGPPAPEYKFNEPSTDEGHIYYFTVTAVNAVGESEISTAVQGKFEKGRNNKNIPNKTVDECKTAAATALPSVLVTVAVIITFEIIFGVLCCYPYIKSGDGNHDNPEQPGEKSSNTSDDNAPVANDDKATSTLWQHVRKRAGS